MLPDSHAAFMFLNEGKLESNIIPNPKNAKFQLQICWERKTMQIMIQWRNANPCLLIINY